MHSDLCNSSCSSKIYIPAVLAVGGLTIILVLVESVFKKSKITCIVHYIRFSVCARGVHRTKV